MNIKNLLKILLVAVFTTISATSFAKNVNETQINRTVEPDEKTLVEHHHYKNVNGRTVHSPAHTKNGNKPEGASAKCRDGSYSFSQHRRGTCSRHGGVQTWY